MILVDTSVLIDFFRGKQNETSRRFKSILQEKVPFGINSFIYQEVLQGARTGREFSLLRAYLGTQRFFHPKDPVASYEEAARMFFDCRQKGITLRSTIDCLIAQIAIEHELVLLHNDRDFESIAKVRKLRTYRLGKENP